MMPGPGRPRTADAEAQTDMDAAAASTAARRTASSVEDFARGVQHDIHGDEALKRGMVGDTHSWEANKKRTYDEYQDANLERIKIANEQARRDSIYVEQLRARSLISLDNLTNNVHTTDAQTIRHGDLAIDRQWNIDEVAAYVEKILANMGVSDVGLGKIIEQITKNRAKAK